MFEQIEKLTTVMNDFTIDVDTNEVVDRAAVDLYSQRMKQCKEDGVPQALIAYMNHALDNDSLNEMTKLYITKAFVEATV